MVQNHQRVVRSLYLLGGVCLLTYLAILGTTGFTSNYRRVDVLHGDTKQSATRDKSIHKNLLLSETQCVDAFPRLTEEIGYAVSLGPFELPWREGIVLQAKIQDGEVEPLLSVQQEKSLGRS